MILKLLAAIGLSATAASAHVDPASDGPPQVMLVGTYHLANNNRDLINLPIEDVLTPERQREIEQLVAQLAAWHPTRVAIEWPRDDQAGLDARYASFLAGELAPSANERDQIGFRVARAAGLKRVHAVYWNGDAPGDPGAYDFLQWAADNGRKDDLERLIADGQAKADRTAQAMRGQSVSQWLRDLNTPEARLDSHRQYFRIASFGSNTTNPGAAWVGGWYARNLRIFENLRSIMEPGDREFVLYGAGHAYLLDRFLRESGVADAVDPGPFLR